MRNERLRAKILGGVMVWVTLGFIFNYIIKYDNYNVYLVNRKYWFIAIGLMVLLVVRAFLIAKIIPKLYKKVGSIYHRMQFFNVFVDVTIITLILIAFANQNNPYNALISPVTGVYFIIILLSILEMDFRISLFVGALISLEYFLLAVYFIPKTAVPVDFPFLDSYLYYAGKSLIFVIAGGVSGMLANRIKESVLQVFDHEEEKNRLEKLFGQQLSPDIANEVLNNATRTPISRKACILFLDIKGFTPHTESLTPEEIIAYQNKVFPDTFDTIYKYKGIINQVMGDGFMATFGAPIPSDESCENALQAALEIVERLNEKNKSGSIDTTFVRIGMHYGPIVTGNIGSEIRKQYSVTGQPVIIASRLEQLNKEIGSYILFSEDVKSQLRKHYREIECVGEHIIKGLSVPLRIYKARCAFEQ